MTATSLKENNVKFDLLKMGFAAGLVACASVAAAEEPKSWLLMEVAESATLANGVLVLEGVDDQVVVFADRPYRDAMDAPVQSIMDIWDKGENSFAVDPPNAALTGQSNGEQVGLIVTLSNPKLEGGNLQFDYQTVNGIDASKLESVSLVIDNALKYPMDCIMDAPNCRW